MSKLFLFHAVMFPYLPSLNRAVNIEGKLKITLSAASKKKFLPKIITNTENEPRAVNEINIEEEHKKKMEK